jgi:hypothetical protein
MHACFLLPFVTLVSSRSRTARAAERAYRTRSTSCQHSSKPTAKVQGHRSSTQAGTSRDPSHVTLLRVDHTARVLRQMLLGVIAISRTTRADEADAGIDDHSGFVHGFIRSKCEAIIQQPSPSTSPAAASHTRRQCASRATSEHACARSVGACRTAGPSRSRTGGLFRVAS